MSGVNVRTSRNEDQLPEKHRDERMPIFREKKNTMTS